MVPGWRRAVAGGKAQALWCEAKAHGLICDQNKRPRYLHGHLPDVGRQVLLRWAFRCFPKSSETNTNYFLEKGILLKISVCLTATFLKE